MPGKQYHEVLVLRKTVWLSLSFDDAQGRQQWRIYQRPRRSKGGHVGPWWAGLIPKPGWPYDSQNAGLPIPLLRAYAFTEWSWDTPPRPNGTDLWVPNGTHQFTIWFPPAELAGRPKRPHAELALHGGGQWMATVEAWIVL